jgi:hypothetical protein
MSFPFMIRHSIRFAALALVFAANLTAAPTAASCKECSDCLVAPPNPETAPCCTIEAVGHKECQVSGAGCWVSGTCTEV